MDSDSSEVRRCPKCGWVSVTKVIDDSPHFGIMFQPSGDYFVCTNPQCDVQRIYGENAILIKGGNSEPTNSGD